MSAPRSRVPAVRRGGRSDLRGAAAVDRAGRGQSAARDASEAELVLGVDEATLLDIVDNVLSKGVVLTGEVTIALANVDLVYARLSLLLCAADRVMPGEHPDPVVRRSARRAARARATRARRRG
jgi:hypothetical protein